MQLLSDVSMTVTAELGRARMTVRELLELAPGAIVELDRTAGMPIDVLVNGTVVARGEVVVVDEEFGVRVTEIVGTENA
jgi:flagellar motor switch protein FliN/FliY